MQEKNHDKKSNFFNIDSNKNEYYLIEESKDLQQVLNKATSESTSLFMNEINQLMRN